MAFKLNRALTKVSVDREAGMMSVKTKDFASRKSFLVTVPCHEDLTANDLVRRLSLSIEVERPAGIAGKPVH
jgi:hypothetical protein